MKARLDSALVTYRASTKVKHQNHKITTNMILEISNSDDTRRDILPRPHVMHAQLFKGDWNQKLPMSHGLCVICWETYTAS